MEVSLSGELQCPGCLGVCVCCLVLCRVLSSSRPVGLAPLELCSSSPMKRREGRVSNPGPIDSECCLLDSLDKLNRCSLSLVVVSPHSPVAVLWMVDGKCE